MKQKKLIFNFFVNRNWKKLTDSRKRAKLLADNRKSHHPIETIVKKLSINVLVLWFTHIWKTVHSQQLRRMQSFKLGMWQGYHFSVKNGI